MKSTLFSGLLAAFTASTTVLAQETLQTGPFALKIRSATNETLDGQYLGACHAGAAMEGLCLAGKSKPNATYNYLSYYYNYTVQDNVTSQTGSLIWRLELSGANETNYVQETMLFNYDDGSNVVVPLFVPSMDVTFVGFNGTEMYVLDYYDDTAYTPGKYPTDSTRQLKNWHVCWTMVGFYYYQAVTWVTAGEPSNPTCEEVCVEKEEIA